MALIGHAKLREPLDGVPARAGGDGDTVAEREPAVRHGRARRVVRDAVDVHGIGRGEHDPLVRVLLTAQAAQLLDGLYERELLAAERLDEAAAADLAARFGRAIERQQLAPARSERLARQQ